MAGGAALSATARLVVQMTSAERDAIDARARRAGLTTSEFVRRRISDEDLETIAKDRGLPDTDRGRRAIDPAATRHRDCGRRVDDRRAKHLDSAQPDQSRAGK